MSTAPTPLCPIDARAASLARQYAAKGDLELLFIRQIAAAEITFDSLQRALDKLYAAADLDDVKIDRLTRAQSRAQRMQTVALKELKDLQHRRNLIERFPDQTKDCAPLADHFCHVGENPMVTPINPIYRGRLYPPLDNKRMTYSTSGIKRLVPDEDAA